MPGDEVVALHVFNTHVEADLARSALEAAGIDSVIAADDAGGMRPHMDLTRGVVIMVRVEDAERARQILEIRARPVEP
jgi:hypothetical protein